MTHWIKKAVVLVASAALAAPLLSVGTVGTASAAAPIKIGVVLTYNNTAFWSAYISYEKQYAKQMGIQLVGPVVCCDTYGADAPLQNTQVESMVNEGVQAIILNPEDVAAEGPSLAYAAKHHVPVVSVDTILATGKDYIVVRASNLFYGYAACAYIASKVRSGYVVENEGDLSSSNGGDRATGFDTCMAKIDPGVHILKDPTNWDPTTMVTDAENALNAYGHQVKAIYDASSGGDPGIVKYLAAKGYGPAGSSKDHVIVIGDDGVAFEQCYIQQGWMDAASSQPANLYALGALTYAKDAAQGVTLKVGMPGLGGAKLTTVAYKGDVQLYDPIVAPFVTKTALTLHGPATNGNPASFKTTAVSDPSLWGNVYGKAHGGICSGVTP
jgi:simple sugar transport system substrate-binding protein/ribose transport system substrate-binding protein